MFLESPDEYQIVSCGIGEVYNLHKIQVYMVLVSVHHEKFISLTVMSQAGHIFLPVFLLALLQSWKKVIHFVLGINMCSQK